MAKGNKILEMPKKMMDKTIKIGDKEIKLNFGLQYACELDNYMEIEAAQAGIDNMVAIATSLIVRKFTVLVDLMSFALKGTDATDEDLQTYLTEQALTDEGLEPLFNLFFTNLVANPFMKSKINQNMTIINQVVEMNELQKVAQEEQMSQILKELNKEMEQAKALIAEKE
ncbi:hypothetical protein DOK76_12400 [Vagococcus sp. DIV0080]|uniref:Phage protein n=1 Tax=Candidatus Vagococcus giribetii TaxID=2230876 RepID=A0ABS3HVW0_9ENTE|nr:tail assembly chaperone [Vagococcus sp. DIV0080]MBO0477874.1 hypothetical protein [Vagococcus sp. DIV0080]